MFFRFAIFCLIFLSPALLLAEVRAIVPMPQSLIKEGKPFSLQGFRMAVADSEKSRIGAAEIDARIVSLGGTPPQRIALTAPLPKGRLIIIAPCTHPAVITKAKELKISTDNPGPQGYVIMPESDGDNFKLWLLGSNPLGTLYAAVTYSALIESKDNNPVLPFVTVRDQPHYKTRFNGNSFAVGRLREHWYSMLAAERVSDMAMANSEADAWVADQKVYMDFLLRAKINMTKLTTTVRACDVLEGSLPITQAALKEVADYGLARGIEIVSFDSSHIGRNEDDSDNPDFKEVVDSHSRYFCWSRLDYHRRQAANAAAWLSDCGYKGYFLHATDSGGWRNPAMWGNRCSLCRKTYGDDHALADATVFKIYYDAIKKRIPDIKFMIVIYPYSAYFLNSDYIYKELTGGSGVSGGRARKVADDAVQRLKTFMGRLDQLLPKDIYVCVREDTHDNLKLIREAWGGRRRFMLYFEYAFWRGWRSNFSTMPLATRSQYFAEHDDILYGDTSPMGWREMTQLLGVECAWNIDRPGAVDFDRDRWLKQGMLAEPYPERKSFAARGCNHLFGSEAGSLVAPAFAENISRMFIDLPEVALRKFPHLDIATLMRGQVAVTGSALESLEKLWKLDSENAVLGRWERGYFLNTWRATAGARLLAGHKSHIYAVKAALRIGDTETFERELQEGRAWLTTAGPEWEATDAVIPKEQLLFNHTKSASSTDSRLTNIKVADLRKELDALEARRDELSAVTNIPDWLRKMLSDRRILEAVPARGEIKIDGCLNEPAWRRASAIDHFVDYRELRLASLETRASLMYTTNTLYVAFECYDPNTKELTASFAARDKHLFCDSVEILIALNDENRERIQIVVDSRGGIYDAHTIMGENGVLKSDAKWDTKAIVGVQRRSDRWIVEIAIPAKEINIKLKPNATRDLLLCRNIVQSCQAGEEESNAVVFLNGSKFDAVEKYANMLLLGSADGSTPVRVDLGLDNPELSTETTGSGTETVVRGELHIESSLNLHNITLRGSFGDGVETLHTCVLAQKKSLRVAMTKDLNIAIPGELRGVSIRFDLEADEGKWSFTRNLGVPRQDVVPVDDIYAPGVDGRALGALATPAYFPSISPDAINLEQGTVEFWVRPRSDIRPYSNSPGAGLRNTFFNMGPIRPEHPGLSNRDAFTIMQTTYPSINAIISNEKYHPRNVYAYNREWRAGEWHHVAMQWKLGSKGKSAMAIYIDGRLVSDSCIGSALYPNTQPLKKGNLGLPIQLGAMNTGYAPADADIDELRISRIMRYRKTFIPEKHFEPDDDTLTLFHFDGSLDATLPSGLRAQLGIAQSASRL